MASNDMSGTPGEGGIRRKPSYSEVLKATPVSRPPPINTDVARIMQSAAKETATTASSGFWSAANASLGTGLTAATPLFSPSIWSPIQQDTHSATIPRKLSWETTMNGKANTPALRGKIGLGLQLEEQKATNGNHDNTLVAKTNRETATPGHSNVAATGTPYKYKQQDVTHAQAKPYVREGGVQLPSTAPLVQQPFYKSSESPRLQLTSSKPTGLEATTTTHPLVDDRVSNAMNSASRPPSSWRKYKLMISSDGDSEEDDSDLLQITSPDASASDLHASASDLSYESDISEHAEAAERDERKIAPIIAEEAHPRNFARTQMDGSVSFTCAFPGADTVVTAINPSHYCMEYGSRVVCIKTDYVENIHWAIQNGIWGVMEKVAARIMTLWEAKTDGKDKVIFVFSVNGQKSYCGVAEMSGPWKEAPGGVVEGFKIKKDGLSRAWGTVPITWVMIKNVSYFWFRDIKNPHSDQDVVNMWNGMHFPSAIAREVVELIIKRPHFTNVLAWRADMSYDPYRPVLDAQQIDPTAGDGKKMNVAMRMIENGRPGGHGQGGEHHAGHGTLPRKDKALAVTNWRQPQAQIDEVASAYTTAPNDRHGTTKSTTPPNLDGHTSPRPRPGQIVTCFIDEKGNFVPINPSGNVSNAPMASANHSLIDFDTPRGASPAFGQRGGSNNTPARGGVMNHRGGRGGHVNTRDNFSGVNSPRSAMRIASTPQHLRHQQSFPGFVGPQVRRMKSDIGLDDPFVHPRMPVQANATQNVMQRGTNTRIASKHPTATFQRAVGSANFVPQNVSVLEASTTSAAQSFGATSSYGNATPQPHAPAPSGGIMLAPTPFSRPEENTPLRMPAQGSARQDSMNQGLAGYAFYPALTDRMHTKSPTEHVVEKKSDKVKSDAEKVNEEYSEFLRRQQALDIELMALKFKQAGLAVPEHLKDAIAARGNADKKSSSSSTSADSTKARSLTSEQEEELHREASEKILRWNDLEENIEGILTSNPSVAKSEPDIQPLDGFEYNRS